jgi:peptide/nickel transport system ATP-binding protein
MIAIAVACNPDLLIADEPTTALDVTIQAQVLKMMRNLQRELDSSVILITHDLGVVANFCEKVAIMYAGEIVEYGTLEDVFDKERMHHPYTNGLFGSLPDISVKSARLKPISGLTPHPSELPEGCKFHPRCPECTEICTKGPVQVSADNGHIIQCYLATGGRDAE